jgi:NodT family efflux transporter outer membrane factor (OMF) lipoprotein
MNKRVQKLLVVGAAGVLLTGCGAVRTSGRTPTPPLPNAYAAGQDDPAVRLDKADLAEWWKEFHDPLLDSLIGRAVKGNLDLRIAQERVREARATSGYAAATRRLPNSGISGGYSDRGNGASGQNFTSRDAGMYQAGFDASYELDLFGGGRAAVTAAQADAQATEEALRHTLVTVASETARSYMELRQAQERLDVARKNLAAQEEVLRLTELRRDAGLTSEFDTTRARAQAESTRAGIPLLEAQVQRSVHAIALLLGSQPAAVQAELSAPGAMPAAPPEVPVGLPSELLRRRPDVRQAERQIAGAAARVGVAVSNLYPRFSLTSGAGGQSGTLLNLLSGAARIWSFGLPINWGILNYPANKANIKAAEAREQQSVAQYEKTVLTALRDVEDALAGYTKEKERQASLIQALEANRKALEMAKLRYEKGLSSFLEVLDAQRSLYSSEDAVSQSRATVNTSAVALYKALGGGW